MDQINKDFIMQITSDIVHRLQRDPVADFLDWKDFTLDFEEDIPGFPNFIYVYLVFQTASEDWHRRNFDNIEIVKETYLAEYYKKYFDVYNRTLEDITIIPVDQYRTGQLKKYAGRVCIVLTLEVDQDD